MFIYKYRWSYWKCQRFNFLPNPDALFICAKAKRQLQMFYVAKAKRQLQLCQGIIDSGNCQLSKIH
ncbi:hypothetical protein [Lysinibacillus sp. FJAT-14222]|uniref:hypothetical protein n=1 Tax=Lysinibacillus sp. FJAT-14222 TaxID=1932366 RepID=UPI001160AB7B|nr:hypothetical protein [Lysinibacillus sp. FJAT-14222]